MKIDIDTAMKAVMDLATQVGSICEDQGVFELTLDEMSKGELKRTRGSLGQRINRASDDALLLAATLRQAYWELRDPLPGEEV